MSNIIQSSPIINEILDSIKSTCINVGQSPNEALQEFNNNTEISSWPYKVARSPWMGGTIKVVQDKLNTITVPQIYLSQVNELLRTELSDVFENNNEKNSITTSNTLYLMQKIIRFMQKHVHVIPNIKQSNGQSSPRIYAYFTLDPKILPDTITHIDMIKPNTNISSDITDILSSLMTISEYNPLDTATITKQTIPN